MTRAVGKGGREPLTCWPDSSPPAARCRERPPPAWASTTKARTKGRQTPKEGMNSRHPSFCHGPRIHSFAARKLVAKPRPLVISNTQKASARRSANGGCLTSLLPEPWSPPANPGARPRSTQNDSSSSTARRCPQNTGSVTNFPANIAAGNSKCAASRTRQSSGRRLVAARFVAHPLR